MRTEHLKVLNIAGHFSELSWDDEVPWQRGGKALPSLQRSKVVECHKPLSGEEDHGWRGTARYVRDK